MSFPNSLEITVSQCITPKTNAWMIIPYNQDEEKKKEEIRSKNEEKPLEPPLMGPSHMNTKYSLCQS